ncbi:MAG: YbfB/YjiJ family MFS transporter [Caldimonas sp.]
MDRGRLRRGQAEVAGETVISPATIEAPVPRARPSSPTAALAGAVALAAAMGIGRFAFTPLLPMMLADGAIDLHAASWLASANYLGYLAGAVLCTFQPWLWARAPRLPAIDGPRLVRAGLVATALLTAAMALPWPGAWPVLRFAAGVASALVFVYGSGWCLAELAARGKPSLGGVMFAGPGAGIVLSGVFASAMVALHWSSVAGWVTFGVLASALGAAVWRIFGGRAARAGGGARSVEAARAPDPVVADAASANAAAIEARHGRTEIASLTFAYGLAGFGYIVTATFLPVIAREALPGSPWLDFFWPIFGVGVVTGALLSTRLRITGDLRLLLAGAYAIQAAAIAASAWSPTLPGFALGSLMLGVPFTAITFFAMQEVRRVRPARIARTIGLLTAAYGIGQIVGPPLVALLLQRSRSTGAGFTFALETAAAALLVGAVIFVGMSRAYPKSAG